MSTAVTSPLERLAPVALDDLNSAAALMRRVDRKYLLDATDADLLLRALPAHARVLDIAGRRQFAYASVYLDTPALTLFGQSAHRRRSRMKVRTRTYLDAGATWLEVKTRHRGFTVKDRILHPLNASDLTDEGVELVRDNSRSGGLRPADAAVLRPTLDVDYRRSTVLIGGHRLTIDTELTWTSRLTGAVTSPDAWVIVETKGDRRPSAIDRTLWDLGHRPLRISKYATGMAALHPHLPGNRWARALATI